MSRIIEQNSENHMEDSAAPSDSMAAGGDISAPQPSAETSPVGAALPSPLVDAATAYSSGDTDARQVIDNKGTIIGNITLGAGSDAYHGAQGILREGTLYASMGQDEIVGGASREKFDGGAGKDDLTGGGADTFIFAAASDTKAAFSKCDIIEDFSHKQHDKIDLGQIDAKPKTGSVDPFTFIDTQDFHGKAGELHYVFKGANTFLSGDIDGDKVADFTIGFHGHVALSGDDFLPVL